MSHVSSPLSSGPHYPVSIVGPLPRFGVQLRHVEPRLPQIGTGASGSIGPEIEDQILATVPRPSAARPASEPNRSLINLGAVLALSPRAARIPTSPLGARTALTRASGPSSPPDRSVGRRRHIFLPVLCETLPDLPKLAERGCRPATRRPRLRTVAGSGGAPEHWKNGSAFRKIGQRRRDADGYTRGRSGR